VLSVILGTIGKLKMKSMKPAVAATLLIAALIAGQAPSASAHSGTKEEQDACSPDVFRLCSAEIPDEARIVTCLNRNRPKLSPACRSVMAGNSKAKSGNDR
jgi:hypothetical protein